MGRNYQKGRTILVSILILYSPHGPAPIGSWRVDLFSLIEPDNKQYQIFRQSIEKLIANQPLLPHQWDSFTPKTRMLL